MIQRKNGEQNDATDDVIKVKKDHAERLRGVLKVGGKGQKQVFSFRGLCDFS